MSPLKQGGITSVQKWSPQIPVQAWFGDVTFSPAEMSGHVTSQRQELGFLPHAFVRHSSHGCHRRARQQKITQEKFLPVIYWKTHLRKLENPLKPYSLLKLFWFQREIYVYALVRIKSISNHRTKTRCN